MPEAWICPSCKRGIAPTVTSCDHGGTLVATPAQPIPPTESPMPPPTSAEPVDWRKEFEKAMRQARNGDPAQPWANENPIARTLEMKPGDWSRQYLALLATGGAISSIGLCPEGEPH